MHSFLLQPDDERFLYRKFRLAHRKFAQAGLFRKISRWYWRADIARAIREHQVVIVCGETGSGKTTQLPKICLELGRGVTGMVGHTQPRRIAARTVAARMLRSLTAPSAMQWATRSVF